jgi:hypothetical protein
MRIKIPYYIFVGIGRSRDIGSGRTKYFGHSRGPTVRGVGRKNLGFKRISIGKGRGIV